MSSVKAIAKLLGKTIAFHQQGNIAMAEAGYLEILSKAPDNPDALHLYGVLLYHQGNFPDAELYIKKAIHGDPRSPLFYLNLGNVLKDLGRSREAVQNYEKAVALEPCFAEAHYNLGNELSKLGDAERAVQHYLKAIKFSPKMAEAHYNLGKLYQDKRELAAAEHSYLSALRINGAFYNAICNLAMVLEMQGRLDDAAAHYRRGIAIEPHNPTAHWSLATLLLLKGEFQEGWKEYEWRLQQDSYAFLSSGGRRWSGDVCSDSVILVRSEQGFGDTIQFARFIRYLRERCREVIFECHAPLVQIMKNLDGVHKVVVRKPDLTTPEVSWDFQLPLMSLPYILNIPEEHMPVGVPYLSPDPIKAEAWQKRLSSDRSALKIGIAWSGSATDNERSCSFDSFTGLAMEHVSFYSLQYSDPRRHNHIPTEAFNFFDYMDEIHDFSATASLIACLDLVITVDTAVAHLAAAMRKQVWVLLKDVPDWRWMMGREDSPWYPTMRLFRQKTFGDWDDVLSRIRSSIEKALSG